MKYTSIFEKLISLIQITASSAFNLIFIGVILFLLLFILKKKISQKVGFLLSLVSLFLLTIGVVYQNQAVLGGVGDSIMNNLFTNIYFPSTYTYLFIYLFMNITIIAGFINIHKKGIEKTVNGYFFLIQNFIFVLILELIAQNKIEIFKKQSLFSNKNLIILLELSVIVFVLWLLSLGLIYLSNVLSERMILRKEKQTLKEETPVLEGDTPDLRGKEESTSANTPPVTSQKEVLAYYPTEEKKEYAYHFIPTMPNKTPKVSLEKTNPQMVIESLYQNKYSSSNNMDIRPLEEDFPTNKQEEAFDLSSFIPKQPEKTVLSSDNHLLDQILTNTLPYIKEDEEKKRMEDEKNTYTLNDYRIFNKMLKDIKEHNQNNSLTIDKDLEYRLITKYSTETYNLFKRMLKNYSN